MDQLMVGKRKPHSMVKFPQWEGFSLIGCIDCTGRIVEGEVIRSGAVWIGRSELAKAEAYGWRATGREEGELVVVER